MYNDNIKLAQIVLKATAGYAGVNDGLNGPKTLAAAHRVDGVTEAGLTDRNRIVILAAQSALAEMGFDTGPLDGFWGPQTDSAFEIWRATVNPARHALPEAVTESPVFGVERDIRRRFGEPGSPACTAGRVPIPWQTFLAWDESQEISTIRCHEDVAPSLARVLENVADTHTPEQIIDLGLHLFGGGYNFRLKRGGSTYSMHSWGIAFDFDPGRNRLRWRSPEARLSHADAVTWWRAWEDEGWCSLGRARNFDWMHVQAPGL